MVSREPVGRAAMERLYGNTRHPRIDPPPCTTNDISLFRPRTRVEANARVTQMQMLSLCLLGRGSLLSLVA